MPNRDDLARTQETTAAATRAQIENQTNKLIAQAQITIIEQAINALPPPVNAGARTLGEGIYAAFKTPLSAVSNPSPNQDPIKLMAFAIAFAILKALWCFIKSLLNPIPIVGIFFPLCNDDPQLTGNDVATNNARNAANIDASNLAANNATNQFRSGVSENAANEAKKQAIQQIPQISGTVSALSSDMNSGSEGMTFDDFVAKTVVPASVTTDETDPTNALRGETNQNETSANIPVQPVSEPKWQATDELTERTSYEAYRRLFGL